ncbi:MAG: NINE protein [Raoultibacter sp.]
MDSKGEGIANGSGDNSMHDEMTEEIKSAIEELKAAQAKLEEIKARSAAELAASEEKTAAQKQDEPDAVDAVPDEPIEVEAQIVEPGKSEAVSHPGEPADGATSSAQNVSADIPKVSIPEPAEPAAAAAAAAVAAGAAQGTQGYQIPTQNNQVPPQGSNTPPQSQQYYYPQGYQNQVISTKDHVAAGLLGIFLGWLGIHKFYLGYNTAGFIMLAVSILGTILTLGIASAVVWVIGIIEGILYLTKSQDEFERLYIFNKREWF